MPLKPFLVGGNPNVEHVVTICGCPHSKQIVAGSQSTGDHNSVSVEVKCPHGYRALGIFHTHPHGEPVLSGADKREARRLGLKHMCVGVPQTGEARCYTID